MAKKDEALEIPKFPGIVAADSAPQAAKKGFFQSLFGKKQAAAPKQEAPKPTETAEAPDAPAAVVQPARRKPFFGFKKTDDADKVETKPAEAKPAAKVEAKIPDATIPEAPKPPKKSFFSFKKSDKTEAKIEPKPTELMRAPEQPKRDIFSLKRSSPKMPEAPRGKIQAPRLEPLKGKDTGSFDKELAKINGELDRINKELGKVK